jgi:hypothetical protein
MLLQIFKGNNPGVIILVSVIFIAVWIGAFINPAMVYSAHLYNGPMPLYGFMVTLAGKNSLVWVVISSVMATIVSFLLVNFNTTSFFINERTYLPALFYVLAAGLFPQNLSLNPALPASIFLMVAIVRIIDGYRKAGIANNFFDAGLLISTGSLFYANLIWFGILVIIGIVIIRTVSVSEVLLALLGLLTPYLLTFGIYYVTGSDLSSLLALITGNLFLRAEGVLFSRLSIVALILASLIIIVSVAYLFSHLNSKKIKSRKTFSILIWAFLIALAEYFILPPVSIEIVWIIAIPVSYFLTHYFVFIKKKLMPEIFLSVLFLLVLIIQIAYFK